MIIISFCVLTCEPVYIWTGDLHLGWDTCSYLGRATCPYLGGQPTYKQYVHRAGAGAGAGARAGQTNSLVQLPRVWPAI